MRSPIAALLVGALYFAGCTTDEPVTDLGTPEDSGVSDRGTADTGGATDSGGATDTGATIDTGVDPDSGPDSGDSGDVGGNDDALPSDTGDAGSPPLLEMVPGSHVTLSAGRIDVMSDGYADVIALLGPGLRGTGIGSRTYAWTIGGAEVTIWFANTNLDDDDLPPNNVDANDRVLWIAVGAGYTGLTPDNIGVGSTKAAVQAAYGAAPHESPIPAPMTGTLAQYYTQGLLVAYDAADAARTVTITRDYPLEPDAEIDVEGPRLRFPGFDLEGYQDVFNLGTSENTVTARLGPPDGQGSVNIGGQNLDVLSYAFIGIEVFFSSGTSNTLFLTVHTPFYGTTGSGEGVGTTRMAFETYLSGRGYDAAQASSSAQLFCYGGNGDPDVGVTYSTATPALVTSVTSPLLNCP